MEVSVENTSTLGRRLKVSVPDATVNEQIKAKMSKLSREVRLKGFRPGKVPTQVLQQKFGPAVRSEVIEDIIRKTLPKVCKEKSLQPAGVPRIEALRHDAGQDLEFTATFEVYPEITLADLSDITITKNAVEITDEDVQKMVSKLQDQMANWNSVERAVQNDDKLTVDFARLLKEANAKREEQKYVQMTIGSEGVLPGLNEGLIGKVVGDEVQLELRYPEDWADAAVAGKEVTLWVTVKDIQEKELLTEEALCEKLHLETQDKAALYAKVRERMQEELDLSLKDEVKEQVLEKLLEKNPIEIPQALMDQEKEAMRREMSQSHRREIPIEAVQTEEANTSAKRRVELGLLLNEVIKKYELKADVQRVRAEIAKIAGRFSSTPESLDAYYKNNDLRYSIERMILLEQAVEALLGTMKTQEKKATFDAVMNSVDEINSDLI